MRRSDRKTRLVAQKRNITFWPSPKDFWKYLVWASYAIFYPRHNRWRNKSSMHKVIWPGSCSWQCWRSAWPSTFHLMSEFSQQRESWILLTRKHVSQHIKGAEDSIFVIANNQALSWALQTSISLQLPKASDRLPPSPSLKGRILVHSKEARNSLG